MYENDLRGPGVERRPTYDVKAADARVARIVLLFLAAIIVGGLAYMAGFIG